MLHLCGYEGCYERFQTIKRLREHRRRQGHVAAPRRASGRVRGSLKRYVPLAAMNKKGKWEEKDLRQRGEDSHVDFVSKPWRTGGPRGAGTPRPKEEEHSNAGAGVGARATAAAGKRLLGAALGAALSGEALPGNTRKRTPSRSSSSSSLTPEMTAAKMPRTDPISLGLGSPFPAPPSPPRRPALHQPAPHQPA